MNLIVKSVFGSHLYGTNNADSDMDYKGIYLPTEEECYLNNISKSLNYSSGNDNSKNTKDDVDEEIYSLQYFMRLAARGEMIVLDMLHTPDNLVIEDSAMWRILQSKRSMFYSKSLHGYLGYIKVQTNKYGIKGSRLKALENLKIFLSNQNPEMRLSDVWDQLPINDYSMYIENPVRQDIPMYECCGKKFHNSVSVSYAYNCILRTYNSYGERAKKAMNNEGIDWKAVSHAFRAGYQLLEIYRTGDLKYPLDSAKYLRDIKEGRLHYQNDKLGEKLEDILVAVNKAAENSGLPKKIDVNKLNNFILECYR